MNITAPLLPNSWSSAFVTYWSTMHKNNFISTGNVWFDYKLGNFRIDGMFNPWDVIGTGKHLWMSEISHYKESVSYNIMIPYNRVGIHSKDSEHRLETGDIEVNEVSSKESILPQDYLREGNAYCNSSDSVMGFEVDVWKFPKGNRLDMISICLKRNGNFLVRMKQKKNSEILIRDFPNFESGKVKKSIFVMKNSM